MGIEEDVVGIVINEAIHQATEKNNSGQLAKLIRLQALYYQVLSEGLEPTRPEELARPLREKLGLEIATPNEKEIERGIRGRILNTRQGPLPLIEDESYRVLAEKVNQEVGRYLEDEVRLGVLFPSYPHSPPKSWWNLVQSLSAVERGRISRSLALFNRYGNVSTVGELRTIEPSAMLGLRGAITSNKSILLGLTMFDKEPNKLNT